VAERIVFNDLTRIHDPLRRDLERTIARVLDSGQFLRGRECSAFEEEWAAFCGQREAVMCNSGTDALSLAATALELDEVSVQANTLALTAIGLHRGGARVSLREITREGNLAYHHDNAVPVLLFGRLPGTRELDAPLFDAAHAHGWSPPATATAAWSFYPTKTLGALGDGGGVTTNDAALAERMRELRGVDDQMRSARQFTSRMDEIQAAVLRLKLPLLLTWLAQRNEVADHYRKRLGDFGITLPGPSLDHLFVIRVPDRDDLARVLLDNEIETKVHWSRSLASIEGPWTRAEDSYTEAISWADHVLSLPCYPGLTLPEVNRVCDVIEHWWETHQH